MQDRARCRFIPRARRRVSPGSRALRRACSRPYNPHPTEAILEAFLVSLGIVALAEIGDKTQLLALVLAARYRRPVPVILGILVATLANHALAAWLGAEVAGVLGRDAMRWILGLSFLAMAGWTLIPDKLGKEKPQSARLGAFAATLAPRRVPRARPRSLPRGGGRQAADRPRRPGRVLRLDLDGRGRDDARHDARRRPGGDRQDRGVARGQGGGGDLRLVAHLHD